MENGEEIEGSDDEALGRLRTGRLLLWIALIAAVLALLTVFIDKITIFAVCWLVSIVAGYGGIKNVSEVVGGNGIVILFAYTGLIMPLFNILAIGLYLAQANGALKAAAEAEAAHARKQIAERARQRAAATTSSAGKPAARAPSSGAKPAAVLPATEPKQPQAARRPMDMLAAKERLAKAIAQVKLVGLGARDGSGAPPDGAKLEIRVSHPDINLGEKGQPAVRATQGHFAVFYAIDEGDYYAYANMEELDMSGLTLDTLHTVGQHNLGRVVNGKPGLSLLPQGSFFGLAMGGQFEASLVLLDDLWDSVLKEHTPNGAVVTIPARDMCVFCDSRSAEGIAELKRIAARVMKTGDHTLADTLFIRKDGKWQEYGVEKPVDLPPLEFK